MSDYYEVTLEGDPDILRGFIAGYLAAVDLDRRVYVASDYHIHHDSLAYQLGEWIGLVNDRTHLIVPDEAFERIRDGADRLGDQLKIKLVSTRRVEDARVAFSWETFNRDEGAALRKIFGSPPEGVVIEGYEPKEVVHEDEKGQTGGYAPTHPYSARAKGVAHGRPGVLIEWASTLRLNEFVKIDEIKLSYAS